MKICHWKNSQQYQSILFVCGLLCLYVGLARAQEKAQGSLVVQAFGEVGKQSDARVQMFAEGSQTPIATSKVSVPVDLPPGTYHVELEVLGGKVSRDKVLVKMGRTSTVIINEVAGLQVRAVDRKGQEMGLGVEVYDGVSGEKIGDFLSGELILAYPGVVDVKIATPPQGQWWRKVELQTGAHRRLDIREVVKGELHITPLLDGRDVSTATQIIIYEAGTQKEVARSEPGPDHRFALDSGMYDVFVGNPTGTGKPFVLDRAEVRGEKTIEKQIPLDGDGESIVPPLPAKPSKTQPL